MIDDAFNPRPDGADALRQGCFLVKKRRAGRVDVPIRIFFGPPRDPSTGEEMDRSWRWQVEINGVLAFDPDQPAVIGGIPVDSLDGIWPEAAATPIDQAEYDYRVARADWAEEHDPGDPFGRTAGRIDPLTASLPIFSDEVVS